MYSTDSNGATVEEKEDAFSPDNSVKLALVVQMRIYDVLMALLNEQNEEVATKLHNLHEQGLILDSLPWLDLERKQE